MLTGETVMIWKIMNNPICTQYRVCQNPAVPHVRDPNTDNIC